MTGFDDNTTRSLKNFASPIGTDFGAQPSASTAYSGLIPQTAPAITTDGFNCNDPSPAVAATGEPEPAHVEDSVEELHAEENNDSSSAEASEEPSDATSQGTLESVTSSPSFTAVNVDLNTLTSIAGGYKPDMRTARCVADTDMLLKYMVATERKHNVTMSFPAYGVDPIVFDENALDADGNVITPAIVEVALPAKEAAEGQDNPLYEKIEVDGVLYFSCISQCLDAGYLHNVIAEAVEGVYMHNQYIYTMVGPRPIFHSEEDVEFLETLKLNSFELSALISYMQQIDGIEVIHGTFNGRSAIMFKR